MASQVTDAFLQNSNNEHGRKDKVGHNWTPDRDVWVHVNNDHDEPDCVDQLAKLEVDGDWDEVPPSEAGSPDSVRAEGVLLAEHTHMAARFRGFLFI